MLKYTDFSIVFREIPDQVTLAINISGCPNQCPDCHSPWLREDIGTPLTDQTLMELITPYKDAITCVCFMGGDAHPDQVEHLATFLRTHYPNLLTGWYSGRPELPATLTTTAFNYIKVGPYIAAAGPLNSPTTNQRLYRIEPSGQMTDITACLQQKP